MKKLMLLAAMVAMVLALAAPAMAQIEDSENANQSENNNFIAQQCVGDVVQVQNAPNDQAQTAVNIPIVPIVSSANQTAQQFNDVDQTQAVVAACEQSAANVNVTNQYAGDVTDFFGFFGKWFH